MQGVQGVQGAQGAQSVVPDEARIHLDPDARYLTFALEEAVYGLDVFQVREVLDRLPIERVPNLPPFVRGIIDVRGRSVPVIDLSAKFGLGRTEDKETTRIMVVEALVGQRMQTLGLLADRVITVTPLDSADVDAPPDVGVAWHSDVIIGLGRSGERFVRILDLNRVFNAGELDTAR